MGHPLSCTFGRGTPAVQDDQPDAYTYQPLPDGAIRILTLWGGNPDDPLTGILELTAVDDAGAYEPLSYVWGDNTLTHKIRLPTTELRITSSLYHALRRLRLRAEPRRVWADQICIDQANEAERSQQVQFMNRIYRGGSSIQVWLGLDEEHLAEEAFGFVRRLAGLLGDKRHPIFETASTDDLAEQSAWKPMKNITDHPWFQRGWIVQEIGTRTPATLTWGKAEMAWDELHDVCERLTEYHHLRVKFKVATAEVKYLYRRFVEPEKASRHDNRFSFLYELHRARHLKVTDDRDRVFAMLGHYSIRAGRNSELKALRADYSSSVEEVYTDVAARALIGDDESLITLGAVQHAKLPSAAETTRPGLPSWVPDWRAHHGHIMSEPTCPHRACGPTKPNLSIMRDSKVLEIRGIKVDRIEACSDLLEKGAFHGRREAAGGKDGAARAAVEVLWTDICGKTSGFDISDEYASGSSSSFFAYTQTLSNGCVTIYWRDHALEDYHGAVPQGKWLAHAAAYLTTVVDEAAISPELRSLAEQGGDAQKWVRAATGASSDRKFARTTKGYYVLGPGVMEEDDVVCVLFGGKMPFCLRPCAPGSQHYLLVGECYMHGFMNGEAVDMLGKGHVREEVFKIV